MEKLKILFLAANPIGTGRLSIDEEVRAIWDKLLSSPARDRVELETRWAVRPDDLIRELNDYQPHIVHFSGHGEQQTGLVLQGDRDEALFLSARALELLFRTLKDQIRLVVLNACYSADQASGILKSIDFVVGMKDTITDAAAEKFSSTFYRALACGRPLQNAFEQGQAAILAHGLPEDQVPELFSCDGQYPAEAVLLASASGDEQVTSELLPGSASERAAFRSLSYSAQCSALVTILGQVAESLGFGPTPHARELLDRKLFSPHPCYARMSGGAQTVIFAEMCDASDEKYFAPKRDSFDRIWSYDLNLNGGLATLNRLREIHLICALTTVSFAEACRQLPDFKPLQARHALVRQDFPKVPVLDPSVVGEVYPHIEEVKSHVWEYLGLATGEFPVGFRVRSVPPGIPSKSTDYEGFKFIYGMTLREVERRLEYHLLDAIDAESPFRERLTAALTLAEI